jgi:DinB superfamily
MRTLAQLPDGWMAKQWEWAGHTGEQLQVRDALYRALEAEYSALARAPSPPTEAARILGLAQQAFGDLCGLLAGLADDVLDASPEPGEWSLRQVLAHVLLVERRYAAQVEYAARRTDAEPVYRELRLQLSDAAREGGVTSWIDRLAASRDESDRACSLPDAALDRPTRWAGYDVDLRFRLHRFAAHLVEHTVQCEKVLEAVAPPTGEAGRIVRRVWAARSSHERLSSPEVLRALDGALAETVDSLIARD